MKHAIKGGLMVGAVIIALVVGLFAGYKGVGELPLGSVQQASEYHSTSTHWTMGADTYYLTTDQGVIGSVVITSSTGSVFTVSDADGSTTSTELKFVASADEGTYTFDINAFNGIAITVPSGYNGHIVTTWR